MALYPENLRMLNYIQDQKSVSIKQLALYFKKEVSSIRKEIHHLNQELPSRFQMEVHNNQVTSAMNYSDYLHFIQNLEMSLYLPSIRERIAVIILLCFQNGYANLSRLYSEWGFSLTTKKKDTRYLKTYLVPYGLELVVLRKKGIAIQGDEFQFRLSVSGLLLQIAEVGEDLKFYERLANSPFEHLLYSHFSDMLQETEERAIQLYRRILDTIKAVPSYPSKKLLLIYLVLHCCHKEHLHESPKFLIAAPDTPFSFSDSAFENDAINHILSILDFRPALAVPQSPALEADVRGFFQSVCSELNLNFYTERQVFQELYTYLYKKISAHFYHIELSDKLVKHTEQHEREIYACISEYASFFLKNWQFQMNQDHISAITLMMKKWILRNKIIGREKMRLILITNTIQEKLEYFVETLKEYFDFKIVAVLDINELYQIETLSYQHIITLSDRTSLVLEKLGFPYIRLHFFLTDSDISILKGLGFPTRASRFIAHNFISQIYSGCSEKDAEEYLLENYGDYFI